MRGLITKICSALIGLCCATAPAHAGGFPDPGDECTDPIFLNCNSTVNINLATTTSHPSDPSFTCRVPASGQGVNSAWFRFVAPSPDATLTTGLVTGGNANDTLLAVYSGACNALVQIGCSDDISGTNLLSRVTLNNLTPGQEYTVQLAAYAASDVGTYSLNLDCRPPYDECAGALTVTCNTAVEVNLGITTTNPADPIFPCRLNGNPVQPGVNSAWVRFIAGTTNIRLTVLATEGSPNQNTLMAAFIGVGCGGLTLFSCNDDFDSTGLSQLNITTEIGREFWVQIAANSAADVKKYRLLLECNPGCADCVAGAVQENEICGFRTNGICTSGQPISCGGANICGTLSSAANGFEQDIDFYAFNVDTNTVLNWCVASPQPISIAITSNPFCGGGPPVIVFDNEALSGCESGCVSAVVPPGSYFVAVAVESSVTTCGAANHYAGTFSTSILCPGDFNEDNRVDTSDLLRFLGQFGQPQFSDCSKFDIIRDGQIDTADLIRFLARFGGLCLPPPPPPGP